MIDENDEDRGMRVIDENGCLMIDEDGGCMDEDGKMRNDM